MSLESHQNSSQTPTQCIYVSPVIEKFLERDGKIEYERYYISSTYEVYIYNETKDFLIVTKFAKQIFDLGETDLHDAIENARKILEESINEVSEIQIYNYSKFSNSYYPFITVTKHSVEIYSYASTPTPRFEKINISSSLSIFDEIINLLEKLIKCRITFNDYIDEVIKTVKSIVIDFIENAVPPA